MIATNNNKMKSKTERSRSSLTQVVVSSDANTVSNIGSKTAQLWVWYSSSHRGVEAECICNA